MPASDLEPLPGLLVDGLLDLAFGGRCVGCERPGRALCRGCTAALPDEPGPAWPDPAPPGLAPPKAAAEYAGAVRAMVVAHKERRVLALRRPLSRLLAGAVAAAGSGGPVLLVPVPSRPGAARARGHDPTAALTRTAARLLRDAGVRAAYGPLLRSRGGVADQAGLDAIARAANLAGSLHCPAARLRPMVGQRPRVVVCDDVMTTGATVREAQRALEAQGLAVVGIAVVAATRRRRRGAGRPALSSPASTQ